MKILLLLCGACLGVSGLVSAEVKKGGKSSETQRLAIQLEVLQVLDEGLLMDGAKPFLLKGHPDQKTLADGNVVNCYANLTSETFQYVDTQGAKRTVRVYRFVSKRIGK